MNENEKMLLSILRKLQKKKPSNDFNLEIDEHTLLPEEGDLGMTPMQLVDGQELNPIGVIQGIDDIKKFEKMLKYKMLQSLSV